MLKPIDMLSTELLAELVKEGGRSTFLEVHATDLAAEVVRLRELVNPSTPEGRLAAFKAAKAMVENPPKVAGEWLNRFAGNWYRYGPDCVAVAEVTGHHWAVREHENDRLIDAGSPDGAKSAADKILIAAGWELVGGAS